MLTNVNLIECEKCGRCCSNLRTGDDKLGLTLFPDEVHLLPEHLVRPYLARGVSSPTIIFTYQHTENVCIHLVDNLCKIYESRPLMCRSFPIKISARGLQFLTGCKAVLNTLKKYKTMNRDQPEVQAALTIAERLYEYYKSLGQDENMWRYNIVKDKWEQI